MKSRLPAADFQGDAAQVSVSDPESRLYSKGDGKEARLHCMGHVLMENRNGLVVDARVTQAAGTAERAAALTMRYAGEKADRRGAGTRER